MKICLPQDEYCRWCHKRIGDHDRDDNKWWECLAQLSIIHKKIEMLGEECKI